MKWILFVLIVCLMTSCDNTKKKQRSITKIEPELISRPDTLRLNSKIQSFETKYKNIVKELNDSISKYNVDDVDFSNMTGGIERKYNECSDEVEKTLIGYELAKNYLLCYRNSDKMSYKQKSTSLFYSFICFKKGEVASLYLKLDIKMVNYIINEWNNFTDKDKDDIMFYGLLRGFDNGLPDVLKNVK